ncbi:MAG TPA: acyl-CoA dehydrogenase, partial [Porphyromonadaceae bacterium]|nr:acyl-CoA dehydrogenase [Porphyromonadaceae bacterium]
MAQSVGISEAACREAYNYALERRQFGKAIIEMPPVFEMLANMRAKTDASRTILYETCRFVDMYKILEDISRERKLTPEERDEMKYYSRLADAFTPLGKGMTSEYANQNAYDAIQIHGGSGYMKDYKCERLYRDARITNIYEGTTQLQVVAAIRHVTTGTYLNRIREYEAMPVLPELEPLKRTLSKMAQMYEKLVEIVTAPKDEEYLDFHARRLVESAGHVIMGHLLLQDANKEPEMFRRSAEVYIHYGQIEVVKNYNFVTKSRIEDLGYYKPALSE